MIFFQIETIQIETNRIHGCCFATIISIFIFDAKQKYAINQKI